VTPMRSFTSPLVRMSLYVIPGHNWAVLTPISALLLGVPTLPTLFPEPPRH
jgi:hypothetical protein